MDQPPADEGQPTEGLGAALRRLERRIGAVRPGRSVWAWAVPAVTVAGTFALCLWACMAGHLALGFGIPLSLLMALFMGVTAAVNLTSGIPDAQNADGEEPPGSG